MCVKMPKIVDHEERRRTVAGVATRLVAVGGVDAVTVRDVAAGAGTSTAIVSHYFRDKRELLLFTFAEAAARARDRLNAVLDRDPADLRGLCEALLPLDEDRQRDWRVWFAFWGSAIADAALGAEQRRRVRDIRDILAAALLAGHPGARRATADNESRRLLALITGIASQAVFDPNDWPPARQRGLMRAELTR